uniref:Nucleoporin Nup133/Nup155-like N-terminal domain-containing protein n=1 Tax=Romanomermis culicivorax TaxID=13658 RepID=A0A915J7C1_ROMCU
METDSLQLKHYGCTSPVFVREALESLCDSTSRCSTPSFGLDPATNHCWLFISRQVYVWNFKSWKNSCDGLPLPQTGLKYTADLFATFSPRTKPNVISFLCVSPEGNLRLWRKHDNPSDYVDFNVDLGGQVAEIIRKINDQDAFLLVTSTCNVFLLKISPESSKLLSVIAFKSGQDAMTSFSRRFSSFLFSAPTTTNDSKLCGFVTITDKFDNNLCLSIVLTSKSLLCWQLSFSNNEYKLLWEYDMDKIIINQAIKNIWSLNDPQATSRFRMSVSYTFLDCEYYDGEIYVLIALTNRSYSPDIHHVLCSFADLHAQPAKPEKLIRLNKIDEVRSCS